LFKRQFATSEAAVDAAKPPWVAVAVKHYLQVTEDHFKQAAQNAAHLLPHQGAAMTIWPN